MLQYQLLLIDSSTAGLTSNQVAPGAAGVAISPTSDAIALGPDTWTEYPKTSVRAPILFVRILPSSNYRHCAFRPDLGTDSGGTWAPVPCGVGRLSDALGQRSGQPVRGSPQQLNTA